MLYRFYQNGIRTTIEARSESDAKRKFKALKQDYRAEFKRGNPTTPRLHYPAIRVARLDGLHILNAFDRGFAEGLELRKRHRISKRLANATKGFPQARNAAYAGFKAGNRERV